MFWRVVVILVIVFWLAMSALLVRVTYFPEGSQFAQIPPAAVFRIFLDRETSITTNTLHVFSGEKKVGHASLTPRKAKAGGDGSDYMLLIAGSLDKGALPGVESPVEWRVNLILREGRRWGGANGQVRLPHDGVVFNFDWEEGAAAPHFTKVRHGMVEMDDKILQPFLAQITAGGSTTGAPGVPAQDDFLKVSAREGTKKIAGQTRKGFVMEFTIMDEHRAKAFFTESGELAVVELPGGWSAQEPNIHGLVPAELLED